MSKKETIILGELKIWLEEGLINQDLYDRLSSRYEIKSWDFSAIIKWCLILGAVMLGIGLISVISLIFQSLAFVVLVGSR